MGRDNKSISNELARFLPNKYCAEAAHQQADARRQQATKYSQCSVSVKDNVKSLLNLGLSPEQISGRIKLETIANSLSCNTVYNLVKREAWHKLLARKGKGRLTKNEKGLKLELSLSQSE